MQQHIKIVDISGTPCERGRQYGEWAKEEILASMKDWKLSLHRNHLKKKEFQWMDHFVGAMTVVVRTTGDPSALAGPMRETVRRIEVIC